MLKQSSVKPKECPHCKSLDFHKKGYFYKQVTKTYIPRYRCRNCKRSFSTRTLSVTYRQKRLDLNHHIRMSLGSGVTLRKISRNLQCSYTTVYRKFIWLGTLAQETCLKQELKASEIFVDEMESIEHTKLKPLTIALAISEDYKILGVKVGTIPSKGRLAEISLKKYGYRENQSSQKIDELLLQVSSQMKTAPVVVKSDAKSAYRSLIAKHFPHSLHQAFLSRSNKEARREKKYTTLEKTTYDPMFTLNQRCALLRDHIKRLTRRSWCTTKKIEHLEKHLWLYIIEHNDYQFI